MSKTQKKVTKQVSSSSEEDSSDNNNDEDQELMIGDGNAMGGFDDKRIDSTNEEAARKRKEAKEGNIIRKFAFLTQIQI